MPRQDENQNAIFPSFRAMTRRIAFAVFPQFQLMDVAGPIAVFDFANLAVPGSYALELCAPGGGAMPSSAGVAMHARVLGTGPFDTIFVSGGYGLQHRATMAALRKWLIEEAPRARRIAGICVGSYAMAEAGLLDGRRATTHWGWIDDFAARFPWVMAERNAIFLRDGPCWTSSGISSGIELAIALVAEDLGKDVALTVTQEMFVHIRDQGGHLQPSRLQAIGSGSLRFVELQRWMRANIGGRLNVEDLADKVAMSTRNFARLFRQETGLTPAKAIEQMRLDAARSLLEVGSDPVEAIAMRTGFGDPERMRRAFRRQEGMSPSAVRRTARRLDAEVDPFCRIP
jgi:transcriptional regulator GlxA family with amidase domain